MCESWPGVRFPQAGEHQQQHKSQALVSGHMGVSWVMVGHGVGLVGVVTGT